MKEITGDLIELAKQGEFDVIVHGCNCFCAMGAGIAAAIKQAFPEAHQADLATAEGQRAKLGTYSSAQVQCGTHQVVVVNAYTQYHWRGRGVLADYTAIEQVFTAIKRDFAGARIGYPLIGAGLAGGDWQRIRRLITHALDQEDHTLVTLPDR
ncbi:macro domain-containing protein [Neptunomonas sp. XY-337]|uniref:macro domain-containing protein n=1 Tax=Neptunomonas sp. XY-337 TaxID=2561897 RepID=UPI0010AA9586|nr:macro domain-containing protein [Neptunomonas sp. XY-337]